MEKRTPQEVLKFAREKNARVLDLKFVDLPGTWQHFSLPIGSLKEDAFEEGFGFDGSSIRGWKHINESDMIVVPDPNTAFMDPFMQDADPVADLQHLRPHHQGKLSARSALHRHQGRGVPEVHRHRRHASSSGPKPSSSSSTTCVSTRRQHDGYYYLDSAEGAWNTGRDEKPNLGYKLALQGRLLPRSADRHAAGHPQRDDARDHGPAASRWKRSTTRWPPPASAKSTCKFDTLTRMGDS